MGDQVWFMTSRQTLPDLVACQIATKVEIRDSVFTIHRYWGERFGSRSRCLGSYRDTGRVARHGSSIDRLERVLKV